MKNDALLIAILIFSTSISKFAFANDRLLAFDNAVAAHKCIQLTVERVKLNAQVWENIRGRLRVKRTN
jgi:hypothetical protein